MVSGIERALSACLPLLEEVLTELRRDGAPFNMRSANRAATVDMSALWEEEEAYVQRTRSKEWADLLRSADEKLYRLLRANKLGTDEWHQAAEAYNNLQESYSDDYYKDRLLWSICHVSFPSSRRSSCPLLRSSASVVAISAS
jgi:hypothetical protein